MVRTLVDVEDINRTIIDVFKDEDEMKRLINVNQFTNREDFKSGMVFGMSILTLMLGGNGKFIYADIIENEFTDAPKDGG